MSSRNTFVTSFIYWPSAIEVVERAIRAVTDEFHFHGSRTNAGYFAGRLDTISTTPFDKLKKLFDSIDDGFRGIGYPVYFDIAVVCDDTQVVLQRRDQFGVEIGAG